MKKIFVDLGFVVYYFIVFVGACIALAIVEIINLPELFRRKEKP